MESEYSSTTIDIVQERLRAGQELIHHETPTQEVIFDIQTGNRLPIYVRDKVTGRSQFYHHIGDRLTSLAIFDPGHNIIQDYDADGHMIYCRDIGINAEYFYYPSGQVKSCKAHNPRLYMEWDETGKLLKQEKF